METTASGRTTVVSRYKSDCKRVYGIIIRYAPLAPMLSKCLSLTLTLEANKDPRRADPVQPLGKLCNSTTQHQDRKRGNADTQKDKRGLR